MQQGAWKEQRKTLRTYDANDNVSTIISYYGMIDNLEEKIKLVYTYNYLTGNSFNTVSFASKNGNLWSNYLLSKL